MPMIEIKFDDSKVTDSEISELSISIQKIVSKITGIADVFVYANSAEIKVQVAPIEIFISMSAHKIVDASKLVANIKSQLAQWKKINSYKQPINLTLIPMQWNIEIGI